MTAQSLSSRKTTVLALILLASFVGLLAFTLRPIYADDHPAAAPLPTSSEVAPMDELIIILRRDYSGRILKIGLSPAKPPRKERHNKHDDDDDDDHDVPTKADRAPEKWVYRVKLLTEQGYVYKLVYDAKTLELLRTRGQKKKQRPEPRPHDDD
ncbi:MAG: hypothetical protein HOI33_06600 [Rhodospirillaceae bacterium]|jgi:hypothetical protein|nr:hypothetical protein [Rhodospirillaceae bacterium]MBT5658912.1 hypothetical protein [Rhodospirillaceae bacterium]MBT5752363.1 hypothetical protein [Rhodospirillaceae bacterium]